MITKAKLSGQRLMYYESTVASSREDYYTGRGESAGRYLGGGAALLGLSGEVLKGDLEKLGQGIHPRTGERLRSQNGVKPGRECNGFDFTFNFAKSVSLLHATGNPELQATVRECKDASILAGLAVLEDAARVRMRDGERGEDGRRKLTSYRPVGGLVAPAYPHRTNRLGDPHVHEHVPVMNLGQRPDGSWGALDFAPILKAMMVAGAVQEADFRARMSERGFTWRPVGRNGLSELDCIDPKILRHYSKRTAEIDEATRGRGAKARQAAALETRNVKRQVDIEALQRDVVAALGAEFVKLTAEGLCRRELPRAEIDHDRLAGPDGLTVMKNTFTFEDAVIAIARCHTQGIHRADLYAEVELFFARRDVLDLPSGRFTVQNLVNAERAREAAQLGRVDERTCMIGDRAITAGIRGFNLNDEQEAVVRAALTSGRGYEQIEAEAGTGKTTTAGAIRAVVELGAAYGNVPRRVIGTALADRAVEELKHRASIEQSHNIRSLLWQLDHGKIVLNARDVLIMDERSMIGTRDGARVEQYAHAAGAKVISIGDAGQLQAIAAGGEREGVHEKLGGLKLSKVMRQADREQVRLNHALHESAPEPLFEWAQRKGLMMFDAEPHQAADAYRQDVRDVGYEESLLIAPTNAMVDHLNDLVRGERLAQGELGKEATIGELTVSVGDRVVFKQAGRDEDNLKLINSTRGTVTRVNGDQLEVRLDDGTTRRPEPWYVEDGHVRLGYALTGHTVQGATSDRAVLCGAPDQMFKEWLYVGVTRPRGYARIFYTPLERFNDGRENHGPIEAAPDRDSRKVAIATARESRGEDLAIDDLDRGVGYDRQRSLERDDGFELSL